VWRQSLRVGRPFTAVWTGPRSVQPMVSLARILLRINVQAWAPELPEPIRQTATECRVDYGNGERDEGLEVDGARAEVASSLAIGRWLSPMCT